MAHAAYAAALRPQVSFADMSRVGTLAAAREAGVLRSEGKEYVVQDGDVMLFRFNV